MTLSPAFKRIAIAAVFVAEVGLMAAIAFGAQELPVGAMITGDDEVAITVRDQAVYGAIAVERVVTPVDGWVIVRADHGDGVPGELIGAAPVHRGENLNVPVALDVSRDLPPGAFVSIVADLGARGEFEYTTGSPDDTFSLEGGGGGMMAAAADAPTDMGELMDLPLVDTSGRPIAESLQITSFDVSHRLSEADIGGAFLDASGDAAEILDVDAPAESWVVIIRVDNGGEDENEVIGSARVAAGHTDRLTVTAERVTDGSEISALLVADLGAPDVLEVDPVDPTRSVDAPYIVRSWFVWKRVAPAH